MWSEIVEVLNDNDNGIEAEARDAHVTEDDKKNKKSWIWFYIK